MVPERMATQVEARSLSAINFLAANPPQYPVNPTEERHADLVLYISRVPGTRDVILSTFKPQRKNVTSEDVANSLYYAHLDLPSDEHLVAPAPIKDPASPTTPRSSGESARSKPAIQRKPLPPNAQVLHLDTHSSAPPAEIIGPPLGPQAAQDVWIPPGFKLEDSPTFDSFPDRPRLPPRPSAPASPDRPVLPPRPQGPESPKGPARLRKPFGPRPIDSRTTPERELAQMAGEGSGAQAYSPNTLRRSNRYSVGPTSFPDAPTSFPQYKTPSPPKFEPSSQPVPFSLTLIRRDPTSGHQWNIGRVSSFQTDPFPSDSTSLDNPPPNNPRAPPPPAIHIHLETSGYAKFRDFPTRPSPDTRRPPSTISLPQPPSRVSSNDEALLGLLPPPEGFARQVRMSYTKSWTSNLRDAWHRRRERSSSLGDDSAPPAYDLEPPRRPPGMHVRQDSTSSMDSARFAAPAADRESPPLAMAPGPGLKPRGFVFASPWDGRCEFSTGSGGRSLRCRHVLSSSSAAGFNPLVLAQGLRDGQPLGGRSRGGSVSEKLTGAMPVSELRFNLPSDAFGGKRGGSGDGRGKRESRDLAGGFGKLMRLDPRRASTTSEEDFEDDAPLDLSLGREAAGGGNRGKRAKLGKLIIHSEGLKMLDLVVASNIGIWWGTWERRL